MNKTSKRIISLFMMILMVFSVVPQFCISAFAEELTDLSVRVYDNPHIVEHTSQYRYRIKQHQISSASSISGWTKGSEESPTYSSWSSTKTSTSQPTASDTLQITKTDTETQYRYKTYVGKNGSQSWLHFCPKMAENRYGNSFSASYTSWSTTKRSGSTHDQKHDTSGGATSTKACTYCGLKSGQSPQKYTISGNTYYHEETKTVTVKWYYQTRTKTRNYNYTKYTDWSSWSFNEVNSLDELSFSKESGVDYTLEKENRKVAVDKYGIIYSEDMTKIYYVPVEFHAESFIIPSSVKEISDSAFYGCTGIKEVIIPKAVTKIGTNAFNGCTALESVIIPENVTSIGASAFANCSALGSVFFKTDSPPSLGTNCFSNTLIDCIYVYFLEFKDSWLTYEKSWNGYPLKGYNPPGELYSSIDANSKDKQGFTYSLNTSNKTATITGYSGGANVVFPKRVIKDSVEYAVTAFSANAFKGKTNITKVSMTKLISAIPAYAFDGCTGLTELSYNGSFSSIGEYAFRNCSNLKYFDYLKGLTSIANGVFYNCSKLMDISIPSSVKTIGEYAFYGCAKIGNLSIPSSITTIGSSSFNGCKAMAMVTFEGSPNIGANSFANCTALTKAKFKNNPPSSVGSGAFSTNSSFGVEYPTNNSKWKSQVSNFSWNGYKALSTEIVTKFGINAYVIQVVSPKGNKLYNAAVKLGNQSALIDTYGNAYFSKPSSKTVSITVISTDKEYQEYSNSTYTIKKTPYDVIKLSYETGTVYGLRFNDKDIKSGKVAINTGYSDKKSILTVNVSSPQKVTKLEVMSGNSVIASQKNIAAGKRLVDFSITNRLITVGKKLKVKMTLADGQVTWSEPLKIVPFKLSSTDFEVGFSPKEKNSPEQQIDLSSSKYSLFRGIKLTLPSGENVWKHITVSAKNGETSIIYGLNCNPDKDFNDKTILNQIKKNTKKLSENKLSKSLNGGICGEVEIAYNPNSETFYAKRVSVFLYAECKATAGVTMTFTVPVRVELEVKGKITAKISFEAVETKAKVNVEFKGLSFTLDLSVKLSAGVGVKAASAGVYGKYSFQWDIPSTLYGTGEAGLYIKVLGLKYDHVLIKSKKEKLLPRPKSAKSAPGYGYLSELYDPENLTPIDRDYLDTRSEWLSGLSARKLKAKASVIENTANLSTLQTSAYEYVEPKIITCNGTTMMVYADDIANRSQNNMQALVYSIYSPTTGAWSVPQKIDNNDTFDNNFELYSDGSYIYVIYSESNKVFGDGDVIEEISSSNDISIAIFNTATGSFDKVEPINNDDIYDITPSFAVINGVPTAVWVRNIDNNIFGMDNSNEIVYSQFVEGAWSEPSVIVSKMPMVTSLAIGELNGTPYVSATSDADNNPDTVDDNKLIISDFNGLIKEIETGINNNANTQFVSFKGADILIWSNNGQILSLTDGSGIPTAMIASEENMVDPNFDWVDCGNGKYAVTFVSANEEEGSNVYTIYYDGKDWNHPVKVTYTDKYVGAYDVSYVNGKFIIPYRDTTVTFSDTEDTFSTSANLCVAYISPVSEAYVTDAILDRQTMALGENAEMTLSVFNNGFNDIETAKITMTNAAGDIVFSSNENVQLASGESKDIDIAFIAPATVEDGLYQITVEDANGANKAELKSYAIDLWQSDLCVEAEQLILGDENSLIVNISNDGFVPSAAGQLNIANGIYDSEAEAFASIDFAGIEPGTTETYLVELNDNIYTDDDLSGIVTAWITTEGADATEANNYSTVSIDRFEDAEGYDEEEIVRYAPELSTDTISVDIAVPNDAQITVVNNGNTFSGINGLTDGTQYTYSEDTLTFKETYLSNLEKGIHEVELMFNKGLENEYIASVIITVTDSTAMHLSGTIDIEGEPVYGNTIFVDTDNIEPLNANFRIEWKRGSEIIGTNENYTITEDDINKPITVSVVSEDGYEGNISSVAVTPVKANGVALLSAVAESVSQTSVTLVKYDGYEYRIAGGSWGSNNEFNNLTPNKEYSFEIRKAETNTHFASDASTSLTLRTSSYALEGNVSISGDAKRGNIVKAEVTANSDEQYKYEWYRNGCLIVGAETDSYTLTKDDVNCLVQVKVISSDKYVGELMSAPITVICVHEFEWTTKAEATCTNTGSRVGICVCGEKVAETIPVTSHRYKTNSVAATCTTDGVTETKCSVCGNVKDRIVISATGHKPKVTIPAKDATCIEPGNTAEKICSVCHTVISTFEITPTTAHKEGNNGKCINCGADMQAEREKNCSCNCHKSGFAGFIWKIINFFNKIFKSNPVCACGKKHY